MRRKWGWLMVFAGLVAPPTLAQLKTDAERIREVNALSSQIKRANLDAKSSKKGARVSENNKSTVRPPLALSTPSASSTPLAKPTVTPSPTKLNKTVKSVPSPTPPASDAPARLILKPEDIPEELHFPEEVPAKKK